MNREDIGRLVLQSHSGRDFLDGIAKNFTMADYRVAIDADYEPHPLLARMTYTGERGVVINAPQSDLDTVARHSSGLDKGQTLSVVNAGTLTPAYQFVSSIVNRLDLEACGAGLITSIINAGRAALAVHMLDNLFNSSSTIWTDNAVPLGQEDEKPLGYRRWVVGGSLAIQRAALQAGGLDALTASLSAVQTIGLPLSGLPEDTLLVVDPSALYWCGQRDATAYVDYDSLRTRNQVRVITEQAVACWYDPNRVQPLQLT